MHVHVLLDGALGGHVRDDGHGQRVHRGTEVLQHAVLTVRHMYVEHFATLLLGSLPSQETNDPRDDNLAYLSAKQSSCPYIEGHEYTVK